MGVFVGEQGGLGAADIIVHERSQGRAIVTRLVMFDSLRNDVVGQGPEEMIATVVCPAIQRLSLPEQRFVVAYRPGLQVQSRLRVCRQVQEYCRWTSQLDRSQVLSDEHRGIRENTQRFRFECDPIACRALRLQGTSDL